MGLEHGISAPRGNVLMGTRHIKIIYCTFFRYAIHLPFFLQFYLKKGHFDPFLVVHFWPIFIMSYILIFSLQKCSEIKYCNFIPVQRIYNLHLLDYLSRPGWLLLCIYSPVKITLDRDKIAIFYFTTFL